MPRKLVVPIPGIDTEEEDVGPARNQYQRRGEWARDYRSYPGTSTLHVWPTTPEAYVDGYGRLHGSAKVV